MGFYAFRSLKGSINQAAFLTYCNFSSYFEELENLNDPEFHHAVFSMDRLTPFCSTMFGDYNQELWNRAEYIVEATDIHDLSFHESKIWPGRLGKTVETLDFC